MLRIGLRTAGFAAKGSVRNLIDRSNDMGVYLPTLPMYVCMHRLLLIIYLFFVWL